MKNSIKLLGMTAAVALLSAPVMAHQSKKVDLDGDGYAEATIKYSNSKSAFHRLDENHDGKISREEFTRNSQHDNEPAVFAMFDQNQSGYITREELSSKEKQFARPGNAGEGTTTNLKSKSGQRVGGLDQKYYIDNPFYDDPEIPNSQDTNYDIDNPFVDDPELANDVNWEWPERIDRSEPLFPQLDTNNNGSISKAEFQNGTIHNNEAQVFAMLDKNQSGSLSRYELKKYSKMGGIK